MNTQNKWIYCVITENILCKVWGSCCNWCCYWRYWQKMHVCNAFIFLYVVHICWQRGSVVSLTCAWSMVDRWPLCG